jgi:hypothetical protein
MNLSLNYDHLPAGHKTARKRGTIWEFVRFMAKHRKSMTWKDLVPPLTWQQATMALSQLAKLGELKRIKGIPSIYSRQPNTK